MVSHLTGHGLDASSLSAKYLLAASADNGLIRVVSPAQGALVVAVYLVIFGGLAALVFARRDIAGRTG